MKKPHSLNTVARLNQARERQARREFAESRKHLRRQEGRLEELKEFRRQYLQRLERAGSQGMAMGQLNEYHIFLSRLDQALGQQRRLVEQCRLVVEQRRQHWLSCRVDRKAVEKLVERRTREQRRRQDRVEQQQMDERAAVSGNLARKLFGTRSSPLQRRKAHR